MHGFFNIVCQLTAIFDWEQKRLYLLNDIFSWNFPSFITVKIANRSKSMVLKNHFSAPIFINEFKLSFMYDSIITVRLSIVCYKFMLEMSQFSHFQSCNRKRAYLFLMKKRSNTHKYTFFFLFLGRYFKGIVLSNILYEWLHNSYDCIHCTHGTLMLRTDTLMKFETK